MSQRFSDIRMVEWKSNSAEEGWVGGWLGATCPTSTRGWINNQKSNFNLWVFLLLSDRWPPSLTIQALQWNLFVWSFFAGEHFHGLRNVWPHQSNFPSYFLSYSEAAVLAFSVTPGYFNPPHFWIWTGNIWIHGLIQFLPSISTLGYGLVMVNVMVILPVH